MPLLDCFVRLTYSYELEQTKKIISHWSQHCEAMAVYEHVGEETKKPHIHILIKGCNITTKRLRQIAQEYNKLIRGNEVMSCKACTDKPDDSIIYMSKGKYDPVYYKGFQESIFAEKKALWVEAPAKTSRLQKSYEKFSVYFMEKYSNWIVEAEKASDWPLEGCKRKFNLLCKEAQSFAMIDNHNMWSQRTNSDYRCYVLTFTFRQKWVIPENTRFRKEIW